MRLIPLAAIIAGFFIAGAYGARLTHAQEADGLAAPASATISARLVEDLNDNGQFDAEDGPPSQRTLVQLVPWATPDRFVRVLTADDGSFSFVNVPEGDYTLSVWWMSGFVGDSSERLPHALRIVLRVTSDGAIATPSPLPTTWPELPTEEFNPERDGTIIGSVPDVILLKLKPPGLFPYPVEVGDTAGGPPPIGVVDAGQVLGERPAAPAQRAIAGRVVEDKNGNGILDESDGPPSLTRVAEGAVGTLVELVSSVPVSVPLYTASDGSFTFTNVPAGDYTLWIWWTPGFVEGAANAGTTAQPDLLQVGFTVNADGTVTGPAALQVLLKPLPEGLIPFPVETGPGGGPVPIGVVDVGQALRERPAALPPTGGGPRDDADSLLRWLGAGVLALAVLSGLTVARRRARA